MTQLGCHIDVQHFNIELGSIHFLDVNWTHMTGAGNVYMM
jgi:hypothetical protein